MAVREAGRVGVKRRTFGVIAMVCAFGIGGAMDAVAQDDAWQFEDVERVVAISDVHGDYEAMVQTLASAGIIDAEGAWAGGESHLVITGDLLDRGPDSRPVMDLIMKIEAEAEAAGGAVHQLLGNHEVMNLVGDLRYVAAEEFAAFADDEDPDEREAWFQRHLDTKSIVLDEEAEREAFNERYPPGFFGHRRAFRSDGQYGAWLLGKPLVVVINGTAFVHGGLSPVVGDIGLAGVNDGMMSEVAEYVGALEVVTGAGLIDPAENFYRHASVLEKAVTAGLAPEVAAAVETVIRLNASEVHGPTSPLWYRGNVGCGAPVEQDRLAAVLTSIGANRVVIGHTPTMTRQVLSRLDGKVIEIDTGMLSAYYRGSGHALVIEGDALSVVGEAGAGEAVTPHPRRVGIRPSGIDAGDLERMLAEGEVVVGEELDDGRFAVRVTMQDAEIDAVFIENPRRDDFVPELAAYRLDRLMNLDMVPVTVPRRVDGDDGVLQFAPPSTMTEAQRRQSGRGGSAWCPLPDQWGAMYVFDALIHNPGRAQDRMLYSQDNWQLILTGHDVSFDTSRSRPSYLRDLPLALHAYWQSRLEALTDDVVEAEFGDTLDRRRRRALSARRDSLLEDASEER